MDRQGGTVSGFCDAWAIAASIGLQLGYSLELLVGKFKGMRFEPSGRTETPEIRVALSPVDYVVRYLELRCLSKPQPVVQSLSPPAETPAVLEVA